MKLSMVFLAAILLATGGAAAPDAQADAQAGAAPPAQASDVQVTAGLSNGVVKLGDRTTIVVSIERQGTTRIDSAAPFGDLPEIDGLTLGAPSGPNTSQYQSFSGRRIITSVSQRWVIPVRPERAGEFEIPQFMLAVDGKHYATPVLRLKVVEDLRGSELGFLEINPSSASVVEGQPFTIEVRFGWDEALGNVNFADLSLGFWDGIPGAIDVKTDFPAPGAKRIESGVTVNGGAIVVAEELPAVEMRGRSFRQLRLQASFLPTRGGRIEIPESYLNFGHAEDRSTFFDRRVVKTDDYYVNASKRWIDVTALPEEGRPLDYTGAVGEIAVRADADRRDVDQGDSIKLTVEWTGAGNLEFFDAPELDRLAAFDGFRVYGRTETKKFDRRTTVYDIAPVSPEIDEIPPIPLRVFDPREDGYVTVETPAIPIRVRALEGAVELAGGKREVELARDLRDIDARPLAGGVADGEGPTRTLALLALIGAPLLGLLVRGAVRRRGDPSAPAARRRRAARKRLARDLARADGPEAELRALYAFLAARTGETEEAWVGRALAKPVAGPAVGHARVPDSAATEDLARTIARLETAVWSGRNGSSAGVPAAEVLNLADRLMKEGM